MSPTCHRDTSVPTAAIVPAISSPGMSDAPGGGGYLPEPLQDVRPIHPGRLDAHQHVAGPRHGHRTFDQPQDLGATRC